MIDLLYVDDNTFEFELVEFQLSRLRDNIKLTCIDSATEALQLLGRSRFDCILCDYQMPLMNGLELLKALRETDDRTPFVFLTGQGNEELAAAALRAGADDYFTKEIGFAHYDRLVNSIERIIAADRERAEKQFAKEAQHRSELRFRALFENMKSAVVVLDSDVKGESFTIIEFNPAAEKTEKISRESVIERNLLSVMTSADQNGLLDTVKLVSRTGQPEAREIIDTFEDGTFRSLDLQAFKLPTNEIVLIYNDSTRDKLAEARLEESEQNYKSLFEHIQLGVYRTKLDGTILQANPALVRMLEYDSADELLKTRAYDHYYTSEDRDDHINEILEMKDHSSSLLRMRTKTGKIIFTQDFSKVIRSGNGEPTYIEGIMEDVTERIKAEEAIRDSENRYRTLVETTNDCVWQMDADFRITYISDRIASILGYTPEEVLSNTALNLVAESDESRLTKILKTGFIRHRQFRNLHVPFLHKDGSQRMLEISGVPLRDAEGKVSGYSGVGRDITSRKKAEIRQQRILRELEHHSAELEQLNAEMESFTYSVSHDLRAPIRHIRGYIDIIKEEYSESLDKAVMALLTRIDEASYNSHKIIESLLALSQIHDRELSIDTIDVSNLVGRITTDLLKDYKQENLFEIVVQPDVTIRSDLWLLRIALENLLSNAMKFSSKVESPRIEFSSDISGQNRIFHVIDNGVGFDTSKVADIYRPFTRLHSNEHFPGTGIGLATVKRIVHRLNGSICVESEPGEGTTFSLSLPRHPDID